MAIAALIFSCSPKEDSRSKEIPITKPQLELTGDLMTPEILWSMGRVSDIQLSPDKKTVLYGVSYYSITQNKGNRELYLVDMEGKHRRQLTATAVSESAAQWSADGKRIYYLSTVSGSSQLWQMLPDGRKPKKLTSVEGGIDAFRFSPDGKKLLYVAQVKYGKRAVDYYPDLDKTTGRIIDDLMYKHWDEWVETICESRVKVTENNRLRREVRVKRRGKSPPLLRRRRRPYYLWVARPSIPAIQGCSPDVGG